MSDPSPPSETFRPAPQDRGLPGWLWVMAGALGAVAAGWSVTQAAGHHPQGLVGALIPPGMAVLAFLGALLLRQRPVPVYARLRWQVLVWAILAFCLLQVGSGAWQSTGSWVAVLVTCSVTLALVPALVLVSITLRSVGHRGQDG